MSLPKEELQKNILEDLTKNPVVSYICKQHGVSRSTIYRWLEDDDDFHDKYRQAIKFGKESILDVAKMKLFKLMNSPDERVTLDAVKFYINRYDSTGYRFGKIQAEEDDYRKIQIEIVKSQKECLSEMLEASKQSTEDDENRDEKNNKKDVKMKRIDKKINDVRDTYG